MITKLPVQRLVKDILDRVSARALCHMQHGALGALQGSAEAYIVRTLPSTSNEGMYMSLGMISWLL